MHGPRNGQSSLSNPQVIISFSISNSIRVQETVRTLSENHTMAPGKCQFQEKYMHTFGMRGRALVNRQPAITHTQSHSHPSLTDMPVPAPSPVCPLLVHSAFFEQQTSVFSDFFLLPAAPSFLCVFVFQCSRSERRQKGGVTAGTWSDDAKIFCSGSLFARTSSLTGVVIEERDYESLSQWDCPSVIHFSCVCPVLLF